jgi:glycosyltransferase involved in cell wall biosynthesis
MTAATEDGAGKVLMLVHGYYPADPRVASQARAAVEAGFGVHVVALRRADEPETDSVDGVAVWRLPRRRHRGGGLVSMVREYGGFTTLAAVKAARLTRRHRYDVVQVHNPPDFLVLAALIPRALGARIVLDVHDLASDMFLMRFGRRPGTRVAERALRLVERWAARASDAVLTVHEPYRAELTARGVSASKIVVVMNSLDERLLPPPRKAEADGPTRVVYHGTVTPHYGVHLLVEAAALLAPLVPNLRVEIHGEGDAVAGLRRRARELGVEGVVAVSGVYLSRAEVLRAIQGASVGVIPNLPSRLNRFALSTKLFEYVALGIPVVSADLPTIRAHFSDDEVRYFRAGDSRALAEALADVAGHLDAAAARAEAARRRYEAYRWEQSKDAYLRVLRRAVESGAPSSARTGPV